MYGTGRDPRYAPVAFSGVLEDLQKVGTDIVKSGAGKVFETPQAQAAVSQIATTAALAASQVAKQEVMKLTLPAVALAFAAGYFFARRAR